MTAAARFRPVFSFGAWLVMTPHFLFQINGFDGTAPEQLPVAIEVAIDVDLILMIVMLGLGRLERLLARWPAARWVFVGVALLVCAYLRPLLLTVLQTRFGLDLAPTPMLARFLANLVVLAIGTLLLHLVVMSLERNLMARDRLLLVETDLELQVTITEAYRDEVTARFRRETAHPVIDALGGLFARDLPPHALADELDWVALIVVPPASERADGAGLEEALADLRPTPEAEPELGAVRRYLSPARVEAAPAWMVALIVALLLPAAFALAAPVPVVLLLGVAAIAVAFALGWLVTRIRLPEQPAPAIVMLGALYLLVAVVPTIVLVASNPDSPLFWNYCLYGTISHAGVTLAVAVALSSFREVRAHRTRIAAAIADAERRLALARRSLSELGERIAVVLREGVLAELAATSARLRAGSDGDGQLEALIERIEAAFMLAEKGA